MADNSSGIAESVAEDVSSRIPKITHEQMANMIREDLIGSDSLFNTICAQIEDFLIEVERYENFPVAYSGTPNTQLEKLKILKEVIYKKFFRI